MAAHHHLPSGEDLPVLSPEILPEAPCGPGDNSNELDGHRDAVWFYHHNQLTTGQLSLSWAVGIRGDARYVKVKGLDNELRACG